jgi:signal peptidase I
MEPLYDDGDNVNVKVNFYDCNRVNINDAVLVSYLNRYQLIKVVKGLPGDNISLKGCNIVRNNRVLENSRGNPYCVKDKKREMINVYAQKNISGYLILGNNLDGSLDSTEFGMISKSSIIGKVVGS